MDLQQYQVKALTKELDTVVVERDELRAKLNAVPVDAIRQLRAHLSTDGEYSIKRSDGESIFIGEAIMFGNLFEAIDKWLDADKQAVLHA